MATIDEVYAQCASLITKVDALQADMDALQSAINTLDAKVDVLSGDTTPTNTLDKVLSIERRTKAMEFKLLKGR